MSGETSTFGPTQLDKGPGPEEKSEKNWVISDGGGCCRLETTLGAEPFYGWKDHVLGFPKCMGDLGALELGPSGEGFNGVLIRCFWFFDFFSTF